jgi:hypothetical protein
MKTTQSVLEYHLECFGKADVDGIMEDYAPDAAILTPDGVFKGTAAIREFFVQGFKEFTKPGTTFDLKKMLVDGECAFIFWDAETPDLRLEAASDTFLIRDGRILAQTYAAKVTPKHAPATASRQTATV